MAPRSAVRPASSSAPVVYPATSSVPEVGRSSRPMLLSSVLLPEPDGPLSATNSADCRLKHDAMQHLGFDVGADVVAAADVREAQDGAGGVVIQLAIVNAWVLMSDRGGTLTRMNALEKHDG